MEDADPLGYRCHVRLTGRSRNKQKLRFEHVVDDIVDPLPLQHLHSALGVNRPRQRYVLIRYGNTVHHGDVALLEPQQGSRLQPILNLLNWPQLSRQPDLSDEARGGGKRFALERANQTHHDGEVGGGFVHVQSTHNVQENVVVRQAHLRA